MFTRPDVITDKLWVIDPFFNSQRYRVRWKNHANYVKHILDSGAMLITIEVAFGERAFTIFSTDNRWIVVHVRTQHEMWLKENIINIAASRLPEECKYLCYVDNDFRFIRYDWVGETLHMLQHHPIVQMYGYVAYLDQHFNIHNTSIGFVNGWKSGLAFRNERGEVRDGGFENENRYDHHCHKFGWCGCPGGAWAYRRDAFNSIGGLYEYAILGSGDYHMATALMGFAHISLQDRYTPEYIRSIIHWQDRALRHIKKNVGYVKGTVLHYFHGKMTDRGYGDRWKILVKHKYNPQTDVKKDINGVLQLEDLKWQLRDDLNAYFKSRNEDNLVS